jgi:hypothetical protein
MTTAPPSAVQDTYAEDAYRACLHGSGDANQQRSAASQIALLHGERGALAARCAAQERELAELRERVAQLSAHHRWNIDELDGGRLAICRGDHERPFKCDYETYVPAQLLTAAEQALAAMRERFNGAVSLLRDAEYGGHEWRAQRDAFLAKEPT